MPNATKQYFWVMALIFLVACGSIQPISPTPIKTGITTVVIDGASTARAHLTQLATLQPTATITPTAPPTATIKLTRTPAPTPTPGELLSLNKLRKVYVRDGNLYFQDGANQPIQLTRSGKDRPFIISDDGKKIVFYRGETADSVYSINSDGSQEQAFVTSEVRLVIGQGEIKSLTFVFGTHLLLFNTYLCGPRKGLYDGPDCVVGTFSLDTDTGKVDKVGENLSGDSWGKGNFEISPNGKYVSVAGSGHINVYTLSSKLFKLAYSNVITYRITTPNEFLPYQYWRHDSSGLIVVLAISPYSDPADPPTNYAVFRYQLGGKAVQVPLDTAIVAQGLWRMGCAVSISPDRNWMFFEDEKGYLGNLNDGHTQEFIYIERNCSDVIWNPDSRHFAFSGTNMIGSIDGKLLILFDGYFGGWIDATHYSYMTGNSPDTFKRHIGEIGGEPILVPTPTANK